MLFRSALDMTPADAVSAIDQAKPAISAAATPPVPKRRRVIDVAAVIERALQAAGLK